MTKIDGKVIWITGASSGIGEALAIELSKFNCKLILSARRESALVETKSKCANGDENVAILAIDLEKTEELSQKAAEAERIFGRIDILINNGGISQRSLVAETHLNVYQRLMTVNYIGAVALSKAVLPGQIERGVGLHVAISSLVGKFGTPLRSGYAASKHALHGFYDSMRAELHQQGIGVMLVCPGFVKTQVSVNALLGDGSSQGTMDSAQEQGMTAEDFAAQFISALEAGKEEVNIGGKEKAGVYLKRFMPGLFSSFIKKAKVT